VNWPQTPWWASWGHNWGPYLKTLSLQKLICRQNDLSLFFPHDKSRVFHWTLCDMLTWQICHRLCHYLAQEWHASGHKDHWESENKENTGIFVFSRVCPCVSDKQTDKHMFVCVFQTNRQTSTGYHHWGGDRAIPDFWRKSDCRREILEFSISRPRTVSCASTSFYYTLQCSVSTLLREKTQLAYSVVGRYNCVLAMMTLASNYILCHY